MVEKQPDECYMAIMRRTSDPTTYRLVSVPHEIALRIVDERGRQDRLLSWAVSTLAAREGSPGRIKCAAFVAFLNNAARAQAEPARRFTLGVSMCRGVMDQFLKSVGAQVRMRNGSQWVLPPPGRHAEIARMLGAVCAVTGILASELFNGRDPSRVDPEHTRLRSNNARRRTDTDRWLRMKSDPGIAPRLEDPRVCDRLMEGLRRTNADEAVILAHELARDSGNRFCQGAAITMYDLLVASREPCHIPVINKGSSGERVLTLVVSRGLWDRLLAHIDGDRRARGGRGLAELRRFAADARRRQDLKAMPLFTLRGDEGLTYDRLYRQGKAAAVLMDLYRNDQEFHETGAKRFVTFHLLRHEYVHSRMDGIDLMDRKVWPLERERLAAYMGWSDVEDMLAWYSAHHSRKNALASAVKHVDRIDALEEVHDRQQALDGLESTSSGAYQTVRPRPLAEQFSGI